MTDLKPIAASEKELAASGSAPFSNRFFVSIGAVVRITFAEQWGPDTVPQFRTAVTLAHADAVELKNVLATLLADVERQLTEARSKASASTETNG